MMIVYMWYYNNIKLHYMQFNLCVRDSAMEIKQFNIVSVVYVYTIAICIYNVDMVFYYEEIHEFISVNSEFINTVQWQIIHVFPISIINWGMKIIHLFIILPV